MSLPALKPTPEVAARIAAGVRQGLSPTQAAEAVGIDGRDLTRWLAKGRESRSGLYRDLHAALRLAEASFEATCLTRVQAAAQGGGVTAVEVKETFKDGELVQRVTSEKRAGPQWQAAVWLLERRLPERWGRGGRDDTASPEERAEEILETVRRMRDTLPTDEEVDGAAFSS